MIITNFSRDLIPNKNAFEHIQRGGSKTGVLDFLNDLWRNDPTKLAWLPTNRQLISFGDLQDSARIKEFVDRVRRASQTQFIRGCVLPKEKYGGDVAGVVDLVPSCVVKDACSKFQKTPDAPIHIDLLVGWLKEQLDRFNSKPVQDFLKWDGAVHVEPELTFEVCDFCEGYLLGTMVEHPSFPNVFLVEQNINPQDSTSGRLAIVENNIFDFQEDELFANLSLNTTAQETLLNIFQEIRDSGIINTDTQTIRLEYGYNFDTKQFKVFQVVIFRPKESPSDFNVSGGWDSRDYVSFGTTPPEGVSCNLFHIGHNRESLNAGHYFFPNKDDTPSIDFLPKPLNVFVGGSMSQKPLGHNLMRFLMKADVAVVTANIYHYMDSSKTYRILSNGKKGSVTKENS